jgi:hypothetical protein
LQFFIFGDLGKILILPVAKYRSVMANLMPGDMAFRNVVSLCLMYGVTFITSSSKRPGVSLKKLRNDP